MLHAVLVQKHHDHLEKESGKKKTKTKRQPTKKEKRSYSVAHRAPVDILSAFQMYCVEK